MPDLGVQLHLLIGQTIPTPAPYEVVDALVSLEVRNDDRQRDGFQIVFNLGRQGMAQDYSLLRDGKLDPPNHVTIIVIIQGIPQVLINGVVTKHQLIPSNEPGKSQLRVTGEDTGVQLDFEKKNATYKNMSDSSIVQLILGRYRDFIPAVTPTSDFPPEVQKIVTQQVTDLAFIQELARRNNFIFYTEPSAAPGQSIAYWGPKHQPGLVPQPALTMNMGSWTNVDQLSFDFNALKAVMPQATIVEPFTGRAISIPVPNLLSPSLSSQPADPLRTTILRDTANLNPIQAALRLLTVASESEDSVTGTGEVDTARYGWALRSRRQVWVRGTGHAHDGAYYVQQVTHSIQRGEYKQSFTLTREGRGAMSSTVGIA